MFWMFEIGLWMWLFLVGFFCLGVLSHEQEGPLLAVCSLVVFVLGLQFVFGVPVWQSLRSNPLWIIVLLIGYFSIGLGYAVFWKWPRYCAARASDILASFKNQSDRAIDDFLSDAHANGLHPIKHKSRIINWLVTWPFGALWSVLHDPITWISGRLYAVSAKTLKGISDAALIKAAEKAKRADAGDEG